MRDGNASFRIGMANLGSSDLEVTLSSSGSGDAEVVFPRREFVLEPADRTTDPSGQGWLSLGDGEYSDFETVPFHVSIGEGERSSFKVRIEATGGKERGEGENIEQRIVQVREYRFTATDLAEGEKAPEVERGYEEPGDDENGGSGEDNMDEGGGAEVEDGRGKAEGPAEDLNGTLVFNGSQDSKRSTTPNKVENSGVDGLTVILAVGVVASLMYLWTVI